MCPQNTIDCFLIQHLVLPSFKPLSFIFKKTFLRRSSCSCKVFPPYYKVVLGICFILGICFALYIRNNNFHLKNFAVEWIPYGKHLKWYLYMNDYH